MRCRPLLQYALAVRGVSTASFALLSPRAGPAGNGEAVDPWTQGERIAFKELLAPAH